MAGEPGVIEWSRDPSDSRVGLLFAYVFVGIFGGIGLLVVFGLLFATALAVTGGNFLVVGIVILLLLVGGPASLLYLWPLLRHPDQRPPVPDWLAEFRLRWVVSASLLGIVTILLTLSSGLPPIVLGLGFIVSMLSLGLFTSEGEIDTETRTLRYGYSIEIELDGLTDVKRFHIAGMTLCWLSFPRGRSPRLLVLPSETDRAARPVFEEAAAQPAETHDPNRTVQAALVVLALVFFAVPVVLVATGSITTNGAAILGYVAVFLGAIFVGAAAYGT